MPKKSKQISPARGWCFTLNNYTEEEHSSIVQRLLDSCDRFVFCVGKEVGKGGTPHLQGCIQSRGKTDKWRPFNLFSVEREGKKVGHWSKMKKCFDANFRYCSKDGDYMSNYKDKEEKPVFVPDWGTLYYGVNDGRCGGPHTTPEWLKLWHLSLGNGEHEDEETDKMMMKWFIKLVDKGLVKNWNV